MGRSAYPPGSRAKQGCPVTSPTEIIDNKTAAALDKKTAAAIGYNAATALNEKTATALGYNAATALAIINPQKHPPNSALTSPAKKTSKTNSGFSPNSHYKGCKATSAGNILKWLVVTMSIVWLLLGTVNASAADQQTNEGGSQLTQTFYISIPPLNVAEALNSLAKQTGAQLLFSYEQALTRKAQPVVGNYAVMDALDQLLQGSGLESSLSDKGAITIFDIENMMRHHSKKSQRERKEMNINTDKRKTLLATFIAMFAAGATAQGVDSDQQAATQQNQIDEIIVTATKRGAGQSIQDTAMAISALTGDTIEKRGFVGMDDYLRTLPGISMQDLGAGQSSVVIRGLSGDPQNQSGSAGIYFGETPLAGFESASVVAGAGNIDLKLVDVERIEVLRGPQGTLYGSDSMAGTVRVLPVAPNLQELEGKLATRYSQTGERGGDNTMIQAVLNVPLIEDKLAIRGVVYQFDNSGYIDNVVVSQPVPGLSRTTGVFGGVANDRDDVGNDQYTGFRLTALWQPIDELDITLSYLEQDIEQDGIPEVSLNLAGDYQQRRVNTGTGGSSYELLENEVDITSLVLNYDLGWGIVTSASSWVNYTAKNETDLTFFSALFAGIFGPGFEDSPYGTRNVRNTEAFTQEVRLASNLEGPLQFVTGLYYSDNESVRDFEHAWTGDVTQDPGIVLQSNSGGKTLEQESFFGELSYAFTDQLTATIGGRHYEYERDTNEGYTFHIFVDTQTVTNVVDKGQLYKANLSYTPNEDMLLYTQWSEGFRPGGALTEVPACTAQGIASPDKLDPDATQNFELGFKSSFADSRFTFNAALYRINWEGIPVVVLPAPNCILHLNAGEAKSEGVEIEMQAQLTEKFRTDLSASYGETTLVGDSSIGFDGDNLPGSSDFNLSLGVQYEFTLANHNSFARVDYTYISDYFSAIDASENPFTPSPSGGFGQVNLKVGIEFDQIAMDIFVNNLTNGDGVTWVENSAVGIGADSTAYRIRPRTIGLNLTYQF